MLIGVDWCWWFLVLCDIFHCLMRVLGLLVVAFEYVFSFYAPIPPPPILGMGFDVSMCTKGRSKTIFTRQITAAAHEQKLFIFDTFSFFFF